MEKKIIRYLSIFISLIIFLGGVFVYQEADLNDGNLHIVICDVGQGDAIYIKTPERKDILIDGGPNKNVLNCLSKNMSFWDKTLELLIISHPHVDHITGLISVLDRYSLIHYASEKVENNGFLEKKLQAKLADKNITANYLKSGDRIVFSDKTRIETFWPDENSLKNYTIASESSSFDLDVNGFSLVQVLSYGKFRFLLTGDANVLILDKIGERIGDVDVLKVSHHGSKTGTNDLFLKSVTPELAIISVGKNNKYKHPAKTVLELLSKYKIKILRTDINGEVEIISNGEEWWIKD